MSAQIQHLTETEFDSFIAAATTPVLVDLWAPWCAPCRALGTILEQLAPELAGKLQIVKINVDENQALAAKFNVRSIPTMLLFKNGQLAETFVGMMQKVHLKEKLTPLL